ncbi:unnamed protein product, partial [Didymodactylos carnosus]
TCYYIFLFKLTNGEKDLCIGIRNVNVNDYNLELKHSFIEMLFNTLPCRFKIDPRHTFSNILLAIKQLCSDILKYSYLPYQDIIQSPLLSFIQVTFQFELSNIYFDNFLNDRNKFDLSLLIKSNMKECIFEYSCNLFDRTTIQTICEKFQLLIKQLFSASLFDCEKQSIYELSILLPQEIKLLQSINKTEDDFNYEIKCIHQEFIQQSVQYSQKVAVILDEQSLTYDEVLYYVQQLSLYLMTNYTDIKSDITVIGQCVQRSIEMVIGLLSILTIGCIYLPLNPSDPLKRILTLIDDTKLSIIFLNSATEEKFNNNNNNKQIQIINIEKILANSQQIISNNDLLLLSNIKNFSSNSIAYIIYTSGSTGKPKGIKIRHKNFISCINSFKIQNIFNQNDICIQIAGCSWDIHLGEILGSMILGSTLIILQSHGNLNMEYMSKTFENKQVSFVMIVPTLM